MPTGWQKITPNTNQIPKNMSWCQWVLSSALGLDRVRYEQAKQELFSKKNINGVYRRGVDEYAIVYKPERAAVGGREAGGLTASQWAAVAGGSVGLLTLGGLGVHTLRNRNRPNEPEEESVDSSDGTESNLELGTSVGPVLHGHQIRDGPTWITLDELYEAYAKKRQESYQKPFEVPDQDIANYRQMVDKFFSNESKSGASSYRPFLTAERPRFWNQIRILRALSNLKPDGVSEQDIVSLFSRSIGDIAASPVVESGNEHITFREYFESQGQTDMMNKLDAAVAFKELRKRLANPQKDPAVQVKNFCAKWKQQVNGRYFRQAHKELLSLYKDNDVIREALRKCNVTQVKPEIDVIIQNVNQNMTMLERWKMKYEAALEKNQVPEMPPATEDLPDYNTIKAEYVSHMEELKQILKQIANQPPEDAQRLIQVDTKLTSEIDRLIRRIEILRDMKQSQTEAVNRFRHMEQEGLTTLVDDSKLIELGKTFFEQAFDFVGRNAHLYLEPRVQYEAIKKKLAGQEPTAELINLASLPRNVQDRLLEDSKKGIIPEGYKSIINAFKDERNKDRQMS
jgi:hypothetical protein